MKQTARNTHRNVLASNNEAWINKLVEENLLPEDLTNLLTVIAQALDYIAKGEDFYLLIGCTKNRDAFQLNWKGDGAPGAVYATDLAGLSEAAADLL